MRREYFIISFRNEDTGEFKEYYQIISPENVEEKARKLREESFDKDAPITIHIYKHFKTIYDGE